MSIIDDALKKTQASLAERKKKEASGVQGDNQNNRDDTVSGRKTPGRAGKKIIWYKNIYAILCISVAVGALLYTILDYSGQPDLPLKSGPSDQENLPVRPVLSGQPSLPVQKDVVSPGSGQPGVNHEDGNDVTEQYAEGQNHYEQGNLKEAMESYRKAAEKGHAEAQNSLGIMYFLGQGVKEDHKEAVKWCRKAAEQGYPQAQYNLGTMYSKGLGTEQDYKEAAGWYLKAAEQGYAQSQTILGLMYSRGQGVEQDYREAVRWYRRAAEQGYVKAQYNLGVMYTEGQGVEQNYREAVKWYRRAAGQGHEEAQTMLDLIEQ